MQPAGTWSVRQASLADEGQIRWLVENAQRVALRFSAADLGKVLPQGLFLAAVESGRLQGFLGWLVRQPEQGSLVAAGLADEVDASLWLDHLLSPSIARLCEDGATALSYTGSAEWLLSALQDWDFSLISHIVRLEKTGWSIPDAGNQEVMVRPVEPSDFKTLVDLDVLGFHRRWRNSLESLRQWRESLPYFVVAAAGQRAVGYCYCATGEPGHGHLIRMAVHPGWQGRGIGSRLMAEAIRYFQQAGARHIALNTQEENDRARRLYQRFGFRPVGREATALWREL
jgi:ribosomal protein S18 acetylase RimI-like enzyme